VSVAAALEVEEGGETVRDLRLAWGGVAHRPWRATRAEAALRGGPLTDAAVRAALDEELEAASTDEGSAYKIPMVRSTTDYVLHRLREGGR
jgi:xanthine dehydrogenase YagS FAD-binding subunit